jgi:hypothetical protein
MLGEPCASIGSRQLWTDQIFAVRLAMAPLRWLTATSLQIADCSLLRVTHDRRRAGSHDNVDKSSLHGAEEARGWGSECCGSLVCMSQMHPTHTLRCDLCVMMLITTQQTTTG